MKVLVTGSAGHLGEAIMRTIRGEQCAIDSGCAAPAGVSGVGLDITASPYTDHVGSVADAEFVNRSVKGVDAIIHTATLHKPHVGTHKRQDFIDTNVTGTLNLLEAAQAHGVKTFIFTSTTSTFGDAMKPKKGDPAVWVTEDLRPRPKNIYGVTKTAAEDLCQMFHRNCGGSLNCVVLRTSRFFAEDDDDADRRQLFKDDGNLKVAELLIRRADIADLVSGHFLALEKAASIGFAKMILTATTPFERSDAAELGTDAAAVVARRCPASAAQLESVGWGMFATVDRVYDNARARELLGWKPRYGFAEAAALVAEKKEYRSPLTLVIGKKGYHGGVVFEDGPFPVGNF